MPVDVEVDVVLRSEEITELLDEVGPVRIHLTDVDEDRRWVEIERPSEVRLIPGQGVSIVSNGRILYEIAGIRLPFEIRRLQVLFTPHVVVTEHGQRLHFKLTVEQADLEGVPAIVENVLIPKVNESLEPERLGMHWDFMRSLSIAARLPGRFEPLKDFLIQAQLAEVHIRADALQLRLSLGLGVSRARPRPTDA